MFSLLKAYLSKKYFSFLNITEIYNWKSWHIQGYLFSGCSECKTDVRVRAGYIFDIVDILSLAPLLTDLLLVKAIFSLGGTFFAALIQLLIFFYQKDCIIILSFNHSFKLEQWWFSFWQNIKHKSMPVYWTVKELYYFLFTLSVQFSPSRR